ncbi:MAG: hypothetical protein HZA50_19190 [Planctomycetes bacterium]|nr:hypothetical protein [Planctomycetota bacterium]
MPSYWAQVKHTGYGQALRIAARDLFGIAEIDDKTIHDLAERVKADNTPGLYRRILQERCRIRVVVDHDFSERVSFPDDPLLRGLCILMLTLFNPMKSASVDEVARRSGMSIRTLDDLTAAIQKLIRDDIRKGAVGLKMMCMDFPPPSAKEAQSEFRQAISKSDPEREFPALARYLADKCFDVAAEADVPVAVHSGFWGDFRKIDPKFILTFGYRRPEVRFDLFHLGIPMAHDAAIIGKNMPNVTLNLCWCPIISQTLTARMLDELLDMAPLNKIIAFGGDYYCAVHKVYGHLVMAREAVASALARRVEAGDFDRAEALRIASMWLHDNPAQIYRV